MTPLRIATWNIRKAIGLDRRRDPARVMGVIAGLDAGVVALQEADKRLGERPSALPRERIAEETGLVPVEVDNGPSLGWHGNALLVAPDLDVAAVERLDLPGLEPRGALMAEVARDGQPVRIIAAHLGLVRRYRLRQLAALVDTVAERDAMPTVILGDFNEWSPTLGLEPLDDGFTVHAPGRSYHAARPVAALDRLALCPRLALSDAGVVETPATRLASDHLPVWATVSAA